MGSATRRVCSSLGLVSLLAVIAVFPAQGRAAECLQQKPLPDGCLQTGGALGCTAAMQTTGPSRLDLSPDGETVYLATFSTSTAVILDRDTATGILTPVAGVAGCLSDSGSGGACTDVRNFSFPNNIEVSTDLATAYFATSNGIAIFDRDTLTGALSQKAGTAGCINETGAEGCAVATGVALSAELALSPDNSNVYVGGNGITVFDRNALTGELTQKAGAAGCVTDDGSGGACADGSALLGVFLPVVSPDGKNVYAVSFTSSAIAVFDRDTGTGALTQKAGTDACISDDGSGGACADGFQLVHPSSAAISADGRNFYVVAGFTGSSNAITVFDRDPVTGALAQKAGTAGCLSETGSGGLCTDGRGLVSPRAVSVSSDGLAVYVSMEDSDGVAVFLRDSLTGELTQPAGAAGCINRLGGDGCAVGVAMNDSLGMVASADGRSVYVGGYGTNSVAVLDRVTCPLPPTTTTTSTTTTSTTSTSTTTSTDTTTTTTVLGVVVCGPVPIATCRDQAGEARFRVRDVGRPRSRVIEFVWRQGEQTDVEAFGDPLGSATEYTLCVYVAGTPLLDLSVASGGTCNGRSCWRQGSRRRYLYGDPDGQTDGLRWIELQAGETGVSKVRARARGTNLLLPALPLTAPVRVQFVADHGGSPECWEAEFSSFRKNTDVKVLAVR